MRWIVLAALGFRLVALFPMVFAAQPLAQGSGIVICAAGGDQTLPVSGQVVAGLLAPGCSLPSDAAAMLPGEPKLPPPRDGLVAIAVPAATIAPASAPFTLYRARGPPTLLG